MQANRAELARFHRQAKVQANGCWLWMGTLGTRDGYGKFKPSPGQPTQMAHRWAYEVFCGPIPDGMQIDHTCHSDDATCPGGPGCIHRRCCNPEHLEAVSASENTKRQRHYARSRTECPKEHPYDGDNLIVGKDGKRRCRECDRTRKRKAGTTPTLPSAATPHSNES